MFILSLLCIFATSLFNVSNVKSDVIQNDVIYEKQEIVSKRAFTNDEYTSRVNNKVAYRYTSLAYELNNLAIGNNFEGRVSLYNGNYQNIVTTYAINLLNISEVTTYANSTYNTGVDVVTLFYQQCYLNNDPNFFIIRFFANSTSKCSNIEINVLNAVNTGTDFVIGVGQGSFTSGDFLVPVSNQTSILINNSMNISNTSGVSPNNASRGFRFCDFYIIGYLYNGGSLNIEVNLLSDFDLDYQNGYDNGYSSGYTDGNRHGYTEGYSDGFNDADNMDATALTIFSGILEVGMLPVNVFLAIFNFEVFGINIAGIVSGLLTISIIIIILRFLLGGKSKDD